VYSAEVVPATASFGCRMTVAKLLQLHELTANYRLVLGLCQTCQGLRVSRMQSST